MLLRQVVVLIPPAMEELNEAHAAFGQPPRQKAVAGERARLARIGPIEIEGRFRFLREIGQLRHGRLHAIRHLVLRDAR